jgi:hypothetical protein
MGGEQVEQVDVGPWARGRWVVCVAAFRQSRRTAARPGSTIERSPHRFDCMQSCAGRVSRAKSPRRRCIASGKLRPDLMAGSSRRIPGANDGYMCPECVSTASVTTVLDGGEQGSAALRHGGSLCMAGPAWQKYVALGLRRHSCEGWIGGDTGLMKGGWITLYKRSLEPRLPSRRHRSALRCQ